MSSQIFSGTIVRVGFALLGASALAGCSSDSQRFQSLYASVQPQQIQPVQLANQPMPGVDTSIATGSVRQVGVRPLINVGQSGVVAPQLQTAQQPLLQQPTYASQVANNAPVAVKRTVIAPALTPARKAVEPISIPQDVAVVEPVAKPKPKPVAVKKPAVVVDPIETSSVEPAVKPKAALQKSGGWSAVSGTQVTMREGETVYNLSRRFGVPASEILRVNGIDKAGSVKTGQTLIIPTYQYSAEAGVSAPDNTPETAMAKGSRGTIFDIPAHKKIPGPTHRPDNQVAVLPVVPQPKSKAVDKMATGGIATQAPADATENAVAKKLPVDQPLATADGRYKVASGDSLHAIAKKVGVSVGQLRAANGLTDQSVIKVGQLLNIPTSTAASAGEDGVDKNITGKRKPNLVKPENTDATVTASIDPKAAKPKVVEAPATTVAAAPNSGLRWPAQGKVTTAFRAQDNGKPNDGIDIEMPEGTAVKAAEGGTVIYAGNGLAEFGNTVLIRHDNGLVTVYGHAEKLNVKRDQKVSKGEVIALSGATGKTSKPKLHFEVRKNSVPVDPTKYLQ